jgi:hypothetical protein
MQSTISLNNLPTLENEMDITTDVPQKLIYLKGILIYFFAVTFTLAIIIKKPTKCFLRVFI